MLFIIFSVQLTAGIALCHVKKAPTSSILLNRDKPIKDVLLPKIDLYLPQVTEPNISDELISPEKETENIQKIIPPPSTKPPQKEKLVQRVCPVFTTGYYKPQKGQQKYAKGSYAKDIALNGTGETAYGKPATIGVIATRHKSFPKGTVVFIEDYGYGVVEDKGPRHHLDLFMGEGEDALQRATQWGRQRKKVEIIQLAKQSKFR